MENIVIEIKSKIEQIEGDKNTIEVSTVGELFEKNGSIFVVYFESEVSGMQGCKTVLKISGETITLTRFGDTTTKMIFNRQSSMKSLYHTPYGDFDMEVKTLELDSEIDMSKLTGRIHLSYNVILESLSSSFNQMDIFIRKALKDE